MRFFNQLINSLGHFPLSARHGIYILVLPKWYRAECGMTEKRVTRYEPQEKISSFVLRLPEKYVLALDGLVEKGVAKSRNELLVEIVERFLTNLQKEAQKGEKNG
jgi:hypothetical protein